MKIATIATLTIAAALCGTSAATMTWTGNGDGKTWDDADNWSPSVPATGDAVEFPVSATITSFGSATRELFDVTIADGATVFLNLANNQTISFPSNVTWTVGEGAMLEFKQGVTGPGGIVKEGPGEVKFDTNSSRTGSFDVHEGVVTLTGERQIGTPVTVGDGIHDAKVQMKYTSKYALKVFSDSSPSILVRNRGVMDFGTLSPGSESLNVNGGPISSIVVEKGGFLDTGRFTFIMNSTNGKVLCAGAIAGSETMGGIQIRAGTNAVPATIDHMVTISSRIQPQSQYINGIGTVYGTFDVPDAEGIPIELDVAGPIQWAWSGRDGIDKVGAGTMRLSSSLNNYGGSGNNMGMTRIYAGTLLVDNESGSGTGYSTVKVLPGGTLGGTGFIGGFESNLTTRADAAIAANSFVTANGTSGNPATIAPGTIDADTGAHVFGTLTVGSSVQTNSVTFGDHTVLHVAVGTSGSADSLAVYGAVDISATDTALLVTTDQKTRAGTYVLASATEGITGSFASVTVNGRGTVSYTENEILLAVPNPATVIMLR